jgi:Histidyl-tRNA synthetase
MSNKSTNPKGTKDYGPNELLSVRFIINKIQNVFISFGYSEIETPSMKKEQHFTKNMVMRVINLFSI